MQVVLELSQQGNYRALMCLIDIGEVLYVTERRLGLAMAQSVQALVDSLPIEIINVTRELILDAAHLRANYSLSHANAFVAAAAIQEEAIVMTGDSEFETVAPVANIEWLAKERVRDR